MKLLRGFLVLIVFLLMGESLRVLLAWPLSGGVFGMLLLSGWLVLNGGVSDALAQASRGLISILIVLIVPGVVGVFFLSGRYLGQWTGFIAALSIGTFLSVLTSFMLIARFAGSRAGESGTVSSSGEGR